jgi:hypothetical protein
MSNPVDVVKFIPPAIREQIDKSLDQVSYQIRGARADARIITPDSTVVGSFSVSRPCVLVGYNREVISTYFAEPVELYWVFTPHQGSGFSFNSFTTSTFISDPPLTHMKLVKRLAIDVECEIPKDISAEDQHLYTTTKNITVMFGPTTVELFVPSFAILGQGSPVPVKSSSMFYGTIFFGVLSGTNTNHLYVHGGDFDACLTDPNATVHHSPSSGVDKSKLPLVVPNPSYLNVRYVKRLYIEVTEVADLTEVNKL